MPEKPIIAIFADTKPLEVYLRDVLSAGGYSAIAHDDQTSAAPAVMVCAVTALGTIPNVRCQKLIIAHEAVQEPEEEGVRVIKAPVRAEKVIETLARILKVQDAVPAEVAIFGAVLDTRENLWLSAGHSPIRLTEKEVAILLQLRESAPSAVSRQVLLDNVWAYADGVETHTLETHMYRLRQKIELDPSRPRIVLTVEDGYRLGG